MSDQAQPVKPKAHTHDAAYRWMLRVLRETRRRVLAATEALR